MLQVKVNFAWLIYDVTIVFCGLQMSGPVCRPILMNCNDSVRERVRGSQSLSQALTLTIDPYPYLDI